VDDALLGDRLMLDDALMLDTLRDVDAAAANDCAAASARAEFRQGHANRHDVPLFRCWRSLPTGPSAACAPSMGKSAEQTIKRKSINRRLPSSLLFHRLLESRVMVNVHLRHSSEMFGRGFCNFMALAGRGFTSLVQPVLISPILRGIADKRCK